MSKPTIPTIPTAHKAAVGRLRAMSATRAPTPTRERSEGLWPTATGMRKPAKAKHMAISGP